MADKHPSDGHGDKRPNVSQITLKGKQLVMRLALLVKTSAIHDIQNQALQSAVGYLLQTVSDLLELMQPLVLQGDQDQLYLNEIRLRGDAAFYSNVKLLNAILEERGCGGLTIYEKLTRDDVLGLLDVLREEPGRAERDTGAMGDASGEDAGETAEDMVFRANERLAAHHISALSFNPRLELGVGKLRRSGLGRDRPTLALKTYAKVLVGAKRMVEKPSGLSPIDRLKLTRNLQALVDLCIDDELFFSTLVSIKCDGDYAYFHPVHVAMLSVQMGKNIGMKRKALIDLAMAALVYDLGKSRPPEPWLNSASSLSPKEKESVRRHPLKSVREILKAGVLNPSMCLRMIAAFEHHHWLDEGGYPQHVRPSRPHLFSRIIAIADAYDALTTTKPYRDAYLPAEALQLMLKDAGKRFDATLLKVLINQLHIFPQGALVQLNTRELAVVYQAHSAPENRHLPVVRLLTSPSGERIDGTIVDLAKEEDGVKRRIVKAMDPDPSFGADTETGMRGR